MLLLYLNKEGADRTVDIYHSYSLLTRLTYYDVYTNYFLIFKILSLNLSRLEGCSSYLIFFY